MGDEQTEQGNGFGLGVSIGIESQIIFIVVKDSFLIFSGPTQPIVGVIIGYHWDLVGKILQRRFEPNIELMKSYRARQHNA